ncbi:MAG TPA: hypothetical protein VGO34_03710 [Alphaproteobacteria bacterium]|jgi:hypothetical protein
MTIIRGFAAACAAALLATAAFTPAMAQEDGRLRGEVEKLSGNDLTVKTAEGKTVQVALEPDYTVTHAVNVKLADIKPGSFVGVGALPAPNPDGSEGMKAVQVVVFPPTSKATERHGPWNSDPNGSMTNAPATQIVAGQKDGKLTLTTGGKDYVIAVPPEAPIVTTVPGSKDMLKPGAWIGISALTNANGKYSAKAVTVSDDRRYPAR